MNEQRTYWQRFRRTLLPLLIAAALIVATLLISGSALIRIEDVYINRIIAGTYGAPDWRVQEMNPILAQLLTLFYRVLPSVNWYGILLLALLLLAAAAWLSFAGRTPGGLFPAAVIVGPIVLLSTNALISTVVCAFCASAGAFTLMNGLQRQKDGVHQIVFGALLSTFALSLSLKWGVLISVGAMLCYLPGMVRENRMRGLLTGLPTIAIIAVALFGYASLMYSAPELSAYRANYALYEQLQHSSLKEESGKLVQANSITIYEDESYPEVQETSGAADALETVFDAAGWSANDASLFFTRFGADSKLTDPDTLRLLLPQAKALSFDVGRLFRELFNTVKKPQFLLLIALVIVAALGLLLTRRRKGLLVLLAVVIAFGGHVYMLLSYHDTYADIAPFYLLAIAVLLYHFNGEDAKNWYHAKIKTRSLRVILSCGALLVFCAGLTGILYFTRQTPANDNQYTLQAYRFITPYISEHPDMLFVGDNPHDRYKPDTLEAPVRGSDANLLAGSYDLYSPRAKDQMERFGIQNPLVDCLNSENIAYVTMSYPESMVLRLAEHYQIYLKPSVDLISQPDISERIYLLSSYTTEEVDEILAENEQDQSDLAAAIDDVLARLEEEGRLDETGSDAVEDATEELKSEGAAPTETTPTPTATSAGND